MPNLPEGFRKGSFDTVGAEINDVTARPLGSGADDSDDDNADDNPAPPAQPEAGSDRRSKDRAVVCFWGSKDPTFGPAIGAGVSVGWPSPGRRGVFGVSVSSAVVRPPHVRRCRVHTVTQGSSGSAHRDDEKGDTQEHQER
jgi:hypothetical protein